MQLAGRHSSRLKTIASCASSGKALPGESHPRSIAISRTAASFLRPMIFDRSISRSESPWRIRTRTCRYWNISNFLFKPPSRANACREGSGWRSSSARLRRQWRLYGENLLAPIRRKVSGAFMPKTIWLLNGESSQRGTARGDGVFHSRQADLGHMVARASPTYAVPYQSKAILALVQRYLPTPDA